LGRVRTHVSKGGTQKKTVKFPDANAKTNLIAPKRPFLRGKR